MKKSAFFILMAIVALALVMVKSNRILSHHGNMAISENIIYPGTGFHLNKALPNSKPHRPVAVRQADDSGQEIDRAIRRRLDADAAYAVNENHAPGYSFTVQDTPNHFADRRIAKLYAQMDPGDAARIIETMEIRQIISLLQMMNTEEGAAILTRIKVEKARKITEQMLEDALKIDE